MRKNHPKKRKNRQNDYDVQYVYIKERPYIKCIIHHPMKTIFINACAWPYATREEEVRY